MKTEDRRKTNPGRPRDPLLAYRVNCVLRLMNCELQPVPKKPEELPLESDTGRRMNRGEAVDLVVKGKIEGDMDLFEELAASEYAIEKSEIEQSKRYPVTRNSRKEHCDIDALGKACTRQGVLSEIPEVDDLADDGEHSEPTLAFL